MYIYAVFRGGVIVKKLITAIILAAASVICAAAPQVLADDISVTVDGRYIEFDEPPRIINDRVMVPMRKIFTELGADIEWDDETKTATAVKDAQYAQFCEGSSYMLYGVCRDGLNSDNFEYASSDALDSAPIIEDDIMFIPVRAVSEAFYFSVEWHPDWNRVEIMTPPYGDGWIYYSSWTDGGHMYRIDTNGRNRQLLSYNDCYLPWGFQYMNGYIYYSVRGDDEGKLYRIRTDGMKEECLTDAPVYVVDNYDYEPFDYGRLYFVDDTTSDYRSDAAGILKAVDRKTGEIVTVIDEEIASPVLYNGYLYFIYNDETDEEKYQTCCRMDMEGNIEKISGDIPVWYFSPGVAQDRIEFWGEGSYYNANLDGSDLVEGELDHNTGDYETDPGYDESIVDIHEYVNYGIVVYNDGRVEPYVHPSWRKYN